MSRCLHAKRYVVEYDGSLFRRSLYIITRRDHYSHRKCYGMFNDVQRSLGCVISYEKSQAYLARRERRRARYGMIIVSDRCRSTPHHYGGFAFRENEKQRLPTARLNAVLCCREQSIMTTCASTTYCATRFPLIRAKIESTLTHPLLAASTVSLAKVATSRVLRTRRKAQRRAKSEWRSIN